MLRYVVTVETVTHGILKDMAASIPLDAQLDQINVCLDQQPSLAML